MYKICLIITRKTINRDIFNLNPIFLVILFSYNCHNDCHKLEVFDPPKKRNIKTSLYLTAECVLLEGCVGHVPLRIYQRGKSGAYLRKIAPMASTKIAFYIYYLLIISPGIHVYAYYMVFAKLLQENYLKNLF